MVIKFFFLCIFAVMQPNRSKWYESWFHCAFQRPSTLIVVLYKNLYAGFYRLFCYLLAWLCVRLPPDSEVIPDIVNMTQDTQILGYGNNFHTVKLFITT